MSTMDLKSKGVTWVGSIKQKLEAVCQEVEIVRQDTVKYVGNHVHAVGESVKKICSDVAEELLPTLVDPKMCEVQSESLNENAAVGNDVNSMASMMEHTVNCNIKQPSMEEDAIDSVKKQLPAESYHSRLHPANELEVLSPLDPIDGESISFLEQDEDVSVCKKLDMSKEKNSNKEDESLSEVLELISPGGKDSCVASLFVESTTENHESAPRILTEVLPTTSFQDEELKSPQKVGIIFDNLIDEHECVSDISSTVPSPPPVFWSEWMDTTSDQFPPPPLPSKKKSTGPSSKLSYSFISCEDKVIEVGSSSRSSLSMDNVSEISPTSFPQKAVKICSLDDPMLCISDVSTTPLSSESAMIKSCEKEAAKMRLASSISVLSLESDDVDTSRANESVSLSESSGNRHEQSWEFNELESFMSSSEIGRSDDSGDDIDDPRMETIELCDEVKPEESCVIVDSRLLHAVSHKARKLRSYKKKLQDAFASKKRLVKEYEQLAIWYGDIDIDTEPSKHSAQNLLPSLQDTPLDRDKLQRHDSCDSEWELL